MPEYLAIYNVSGHTRKGDEYIGKWVTYRETNPKIFTAEGNNEAMKMAKENEVSPEKIIPSGIKDKVERLEFLCQIKEEPLLNNLKSR